MWFRNLALYRFSQPFSLTAEQLQQQLAARESRPIAAQERSVLGWTQPLGREGKLLVHASNGYLMVCARKEDKIMPAAVVNEVLAARVHELEEREDRRVRGKERSELKDAVIFEMLPKAFSKASRTYAYIDPKGGWLIVDASSSNRAEELTSLLRETLGSLPITPLRVTQAPAKTLTAWLSGAALPPKFTIEDECELRDTAENGGLVRVRKHDLESEEIRRHLDAGKQVTRLALTFDDRLNFVVDEQLAIKRLKFLELVQDAAEDAHAEGAAEQFDADFTVMTLEISNFLSHLVDAFGGEGTDGSNQEAA